MKENEKNKSLKNKPRWYYDACTLERSKSAYAEMFNSHYPIQAIISHLSFGEAYANAHLKGKEQVDAFVKLMHSLSPYIEVVENDGCDDAFAKVREKFERLKITDAMHLAIAINNGCEIVRTTDRDLYGLPKPDLKSLGQIYGLSSLAITQMKD